MSKPYFHSRRAQTGLLTGTRPYIVLGSCILLALLALRIWFPGTLARLSSPLWRASAYLSGTLAAPDTGLAAENARLSAENATLAARVADLTNLLGERSEPPPGILAAVLARPPVAPYDVLVVDQGSLDQVDEGAYVYGPGGTPIGEVTEASAHTARVTLYSTRGSIQSAWAGEGRMPLELRGSGSGAFEASAPRDTGIVVGDTVYLTHRGAVPVGTVVALEEDASAPEATLYVRPYTNPFSLTWVTITRP